jgi:NADH-quinone oxidoreductase subunit H
VWILLIATVRAWRLNTHNTIPYVVGGVVLVIIIVLAGMWDSGAQRRAARFEAADSASASEAGRDVPFGASTFPVPPLDLPHYHGIDLDSETSTREVTGA